LDLNGKRNLLVVEKECSNIYLSGRNIPDLEIKPISEVNAYDIIANENIIFGDEKLIEKVQEVVK
jgi:large subunit ribosomal protein L4